MTTRTIGAVGVHRAAKRRTGQGAPRQCSRWVLVRMYGPSSREPPARPSREKFASKTDIARGEVLACRPAWNYGETTETGGGGVSEHLRGFFFFAPAKLDLR